MTTQEFEAGVIYEQPPSKEVRYETISRLAILALDGQSRNLELAIEGQEARYVRMMGGLLMAKLTESGYLVKEDIKDIESEVLEQIAS